MLKQKYFLADIFILSAEKQPIKLSWREIVWLHYENLLPMTIGININKLKNQVRFLKTLRGKLFKGGPMGMSKLDAYRITCTADYELQSELFSVCH